MTGQRTYSTDFGLMEKMEKVSLKITYYEKVEVLTVPFDLKVSIGF